MVVQHPFFVDRAPPLVGALPFVCPPTAANLRFFAEAIRQGALVAIPTETVYGLAAHALDPAACRAIFQLKGRPLIDPLIVHVDSIAQAESLAHWNPCAAALAAAFWPGPLTLVLPKQPCVPDIVTAGLPSVAVRMPAHPVARQLLQACALPLAAPSANPFGYISPTRPEHVAESFGRASPWILDGGPCAIGIESTIVDLRCAQPVILRPGAVSAEQLSSVLQKPVASRPQSHPQPAQSCAQSAPGLMARHYSPRTPLTLFDEAPPSHLPSDVAVLWLQRPTAPSQLPNAFWLSEDGALPTIAANLFATLRKLDAGHFEAIFCQLPTDHAIGAALRDRLQRAAAKSTVD